MPGPDAPPRCCRCGGRGRCGCAGAVTAFAAGDDHPGQINGQDTTYLGWTAFTYPFNTTGQPAATVPCGFAGDGLPVGLQIVGRWRDDVTVLRASAAFEAVDPWGDKRPTLD